MEKVIEREISEIQTENMLNYSMSIIMGRAVASIYDGLKPVQRRILFSCLRNGYSSKKPHVKSAKIVGATMGELHPHSDLALYDAMCRMAQSWSNNALLIDSHGNMGSCSGDSPAAPRYTEARTSKFAEEVLFDGIDRNAVNFVPNYDGTIQEPVLLPAKVPLILVNGCQGIASGGISTSVPSYNLAEVCEETAKFVEARAEGNEYQVSLLPDFPTGGILCSETEILDFQRTGRGNVRYRCKIETDEKNRRLVITQVTYGLTVEKLIETIVAAVRPSEGSPPRLPGVSDVVDHSGGDDVRVVVEVAKGADLKAVEEGLYRHTLCETTLKAILVATNKSDYSQYSIQCIVKEWVDFRVATVRRVMAFDVSKLREQVHVLEGLIKAVTSIERVVKIVRSSNDTAAAKEALQSQVGLTSMQANSVLSMKISQLTKLEEGKLAEQKEAAETEAERILSILKSERKILSVISAELKAIAAKYGRPRRTEILEVPRAREPKPRGGDPVYAVSRGPVFAASREPCKGAELITDDKPMLAFTNLGNVYALRPGIIPAEGHPVRADSVLGLMSGERVVSVVARNKMKGMVLIFATAGGMVKRCRMKEYSFTTRNRMMAIRLKKGDELVGVACCPNDPSLRAVLATEKGLVAALTLDDIPLLLRLAMGVKGVNLKASDRVLSVSTAGPRDVFAIMTKNGMGKLLTASSVPTKIRTQSPVVGMILNKCDRLELFELYNELFRRLAPKESVKFSNYQPVANLKSAGKRL